VRIRADGPGRMIVERIDPARDSLATSVQPRLDLDH